MIVQANRIYFHCRLDGPPGAPWIVFSNSLATNLSLWDAQVAVLQESFRILRYDQRGHGQTDVPSSPCTFDLLTGDMGALFDRFEIERAAVVGISMGAVTALLMAARHPKRISRVVACDGQWATPATGAAAWQERIQVAREQGMAALVEPTMQRWFKPAFLAGNHPEAGKVRQMIRETPGDGFVHCAMALQHYDFRGEFSRIHLPALLVVGGMDGSLPQVMREMHRAIAGSQFVEIDGAGHLPNIERAEDFNRAITPFLKVPSAGS